MCSHGQLLLHVRPDTAIAPTGKQHILYHLPYPSPEIAKVSAANAAVFLRGDFLLKDPRQLLRPVGAVSDDAGFLPATAVTHDRPAIDFPPHEPLAQQRDHVVVADRLRDR